MDLVSPSLKISDYGLIGNTRTSALVSNQGSIDWGCFPYHDSTSYFAKLLDARKGGFFSITPRIPFESQQRYLPDTNVLETEFRTVMGNFRILDSFTVASEKEKKQMLYPEYEILRMVEGLTGEIPIRMHYAPRPHYALHSHILVNQGKLGINCPCGHDLCTLLTSLDPRQIHLHTGELGMDAIADFQITPGTPLYFSVVYSQESPAVLPALGLSAWKRLETTIRYWKNWSQKCQYHGEFEDQVKRSALALKLLTFAPSGAIVAAPTTSLPEWIGGMRNWDYRYCWLRDASFTVRALLLLGYYEEASSFVYWMLDTGCRYESKMRIFYSLFGEPTFPEEKVLGHLEGYQRSFPVRVGNAAGNQLQLDIMGEILDSVDFMGEHLKLDQETQKFLLALGKRALKYMNDPDEGIWEIRTRPAHHTHSKVMSWVALDRLNHLASRFKVKIPCEQLRSAIGLLKNRIENYSYHSGIGAYTQSFGSTSLDAATLIMPLVGYCEASSPRMLSTIRAVRKHLCREDLVYRYLDSDDGISGQEGCFLACSFWLIDALSKSGQIQEASRLLHKLLSRSNSVQLWSEEIDPKSGVYLGNFPQAFSHTGLINSVLTLNYEQARQQHPIVRSA